jgi:glutamate dehydrogenase
VNDEKLTPNEVVRAILRAPVDLLWNGGIGTYVKARSETDLNVGDRANDAVRINGAELRCRVVGEGGNLGFTQLGRVEFARNGGLINTDAIDNSAGVDCSDHEVNIKILLDAVIADGDMTIKQRNKLLADMTDEVARLVLVHNYLQSQSLSVTAYQASELLGDQTRLIRQLEQEGRLNRALEFLPDDEALAELEADKLGLTRPETSVLLAYAKIKLYEQLLASDIADDPYFARELERYFPTPLTKRFRERMDSHPLRREIIVTRISNNMVNRMSSTFCQRLEEATGEHPADIARAYEAAVEVFRAESLWEEIEALDNNVSGATQLEMLAETVRLVDRATIWLLRNRRSPLDVAATVAQLADGVAVLCDRMPKLLDMERRELLDGRIRELTETAVPEKLARTIAIVNPLYSALDIAEVATGSGLEILPVAEAYFSLALRLELPWILDRIRELPRATRWQQQARASLRDELFAEQRALTGELFQLANVTGETEQRVDDWFQLNAGALAHYRQILADLQAAKRHDLAMLSVAVREVRSLARSGQIMAA